MESAWVSAGHLGRHQADGDQPPRAVTELVEQLGQVEPGEPRDEDDERDRRQDDAHDRLQGDPPELLEVGRLGAHPFGRVLAQLIEVDLLLAHELPLTGGERGRLEVREGGGQALGPEPVDGGGQRPVRAHQGHGRDERLHLVGASLGLGRGHGRAPEPHHPELVAIDEEVAVVELPVGHAAPTHRDDELPDARKERGVVVDRRTITEQDTGAAEHQQGVVVFGRAGGHHGVGGDPGLPGEQREEGLVLHLLEPAQPQWRARLAEPDGAPEGRQQRRVVRIAAVHLHHERAVVGIDRLDREQAGHLLIADGERAGVHAELGQRGLHQVEARTTAAAPEGEVHDGGGARPPRAGRPPHRGGLSLRARPRPARRGRRPSSRGGASAW